MKTKKWQEVARMRYGIHMLLKTIALTVIQDIAPKNVTKGKGKNKATAKPQVWKVILHMVSNLTRCMIGRINS